MSNKRLLKSISILESEKIELINKISDLEVERKKLLSDLEVERKKLLAPFESDKMEIVKRMNEKDFSILRLLVLEFLKLPTPEQEKNKQTVNIEYWSATKIKLYLIEKVNIIGLKKIKISVLYDVLNSLGYVKKSRRLKGYKNPTKSWSIIINEPIGQKETNINLFNKIPNEWSLTAYN